MHIWSKFEPEVGKLPCKIFAHPWTDNCALAAGYTWLDCCIGSAGFFAFLHLGQYVSRLLKKKKSKTEWKVYLRNYIRSIIFAATLSTTTLSFHCIFRRLFGEHVVPTTIFLPAVLGGFNIFLESRKERELYTNAFSNCCLELWLKLLQKAKILKWNPNIQTILFMILSSLLSTLISSTNFDLNYFWLFLPPKINKEDDDNQKGICFHTGDCRKHITNLFIMYSSTGLILQFLKLFLSNLKNPRLFLSYLISPKAFKLAAFLGGYVVIYQGIRCFLYQKERKYEIIHDSLAGFLAGIVFRFQPTIPIFNSAVITIIQILAEAGYRKKILPDLPYLELTFALSCGLLFHYRILTDYSPQLMTYFMSAVTHGLADLVSSRYKNAVKNLSNNQRSVGKLISNL